MMLLHSKLARESCALKNETLPHALQGEGNIQHLNSPPHGHPLLCRGREVSNIRTVRLMGNPPALQGEGVHCSRDPLKYGFPALYVAGPL